MDCLLISCIREVRTLFRHWRRGTTNFFIIDTFKNVKNNPPIGPLIKIRGSKMILAEQALRWAQRKFYLMQFWLRNLTFKVGFFQFFRKSWKVAILFCRFHHENSIPRKNRVNHEKANVKCNKTVDSDFWFSKLCHRDFSPQCSLFWKKIFSDFMIRIFVFGGL